MSTEELDLTGYEDEKSMQSDLLPAECYHHLVVTEVDNTRQHVNAMIVTFLVCGGADPASKGRSFTEFVADPDSSKGDFVYKKNKNRRALLAIKSGLLTPTKDQYGGKVSLNWNYLAGRQIVAYVEKNEYEKNGETKRGMRIGYQGISPLIFAPQDVEVLAVPLDEESLTFLPAEQQALIKTVRANCATAEAAPTPKKKAANGNGNGGAPPVATAAPAEGEEPDLF